MEQQPEQQPKLEPKPKRTKQERILGIIAFVSLTVLMLVVAVGVVKFIMIGFG